MEAIQIKAQTGEYTLKNPRFLVVYHHDHRLKHLALGREDLKKAILLGYEQLYIVLYYYL